MSRSLGRTVGGRSAGAAAVEREDEDDIVGTLLATLNGGVEERPVDAQSAQKRKQHTSTSSPKFPEAGVEGRSSETAHHRERAVPGVSGSGSASGFVLDPAAPLPDLSGSSSKSHSVAVSLDGSSLGAALAEHSPSVVQQHNLLKKPQQERRSSTVVTTPPSSAGVAQNSKAPKTATPLGSLRPVRDLEFRAPGGNVDAAFQSLLGGAPPAPPAPPLPKSVRDSVETVDLVGASVLAEDDVPPEEDMNMLIPQDTTTREEGGEARFVSHGQESDDSLGGGIRQSTDSLAGVAEMLTNMTERANSRYGRGGAAVERFSEGAGDEEMVNLSEDLSPGLSGAGRLWRGASGGPRRGEEGSAGEEDKSSEVSGPQPLRQLTLAEAAEQIDRARRRNDQAKHREEMRFSWDDVPG